MNILFQILLALGGPAFEGLMARLGGPKIVIGEPFVDTRPFVSPVNAVPNFYGYNPSGGTTSTSFLDVMRKDGQLTRDDYSMRLYIHVPISNKQKSRTPNSVAKQVFAKLVFFDLDGSVIGNEKGVDARWEKSRQPSAYENFEELRFIDILPEDEQGVDIASRGVRGGCWYIMNNNSYKQIEYPENALKEDGFYFQLQLNGSNIFKKSVSYQFLSKGSNGKPEFLKVNNPQPLNTGTTIGF
jgi:hypothetical protein